MAAFQRELFEGDLISGDSKESVADLSKAFQVHKGTAKRWIENKKIPDAYLNKDQFYTPQKTAEECFNIFLKQAERLKIDLKEYCFLEPSAGFGVFYNLFPKNRRLGMDLFPKSKGIKKRDYLKWTPESAGERNSERKSKKTKSEKPRKQKKYVIVGNPPFGLRGNKALQFINHSEPFVDMIGFILPQLFESDGKGSAMKRVRGYRLVYTKKIKNNVFYNAEGKETFINVIFQIWSKVNTHKIKYKNETCESYIKIYSLSNGGTPASTRNKKMLHRCDVYLPSTCFNGMKAYKSFDDLPNKRGYGAVILKEKKRIKFLLENHDWEKTSFKSTNSALNLRTSLIQNVLIKNGFKDVCP